MTSIIILSILLAISISILAYFFVKNVKQKSKIESLTYENQNLLVASAELSELQIKFNELEKENIGYEKEKEYLQKEINETKQNQDKLKKDLEMQFENTAQRIFNEFSKNFKESSKEDITNLLKPFNIDIKNFSERIDNIYSNESRERISLKAQVETLMKANEKISIDANNLTKALKGDSKVQGDWGEVILEKILEASGLREGIEYVKQAKDMKLTSDSGDRLRPDIIINLPDSKHVIVDSKVSIKHYEAYIAAENDSSREKALNSYLISINTHIKQLSDKKYHSLYGINSPELVVMFIPTDGAYALAVQKDDSLLLTAWNKSIALVGPSTLFPTLRTVSSAWQGERQRKNALEIANQGGRLYDKFADFVKDLEAIGAQLAKTEDTYSKAMNKLKTGKGNLISRTVKLKELGAKATKHIEASEEVEMLPETKESPELTL